MQNLLAEPRQSFTAQEVTDTLALTWGVKVRHGVDVLNRSDVQQSDTINFDSGEVRWAYRPPDDVTGVTNEAAEVRRTATLQVTGPTSILLEQFRYRLWTEIMSPQANWIRFWLGVFVAVIPTVNDDGTVLRRPLQLADKTYRYKTRLLLDPITVPAATNVVQYIVDSLAAVFGETHFAVPASTVVLAGAKTFPAGTSYLEMYNALLETVAYDALTCNEAGWPASVALAELAGRGPEVTYGAGAGKIKIEGSLEPLMPAVPNVVRFVARGGPSLAAENNGIKTVYNQSTGPWSIDSLGEQNSVTVQVDAENQTQLNAIAAAQAQRYFAGGGLRYTGRVGLNPRHSDRDVAELIKPRLGLTGSWLVTSWAYPLMPISDDESTATMPITLEKRV